jgi:hypothetical protein
VTLLDFEHFDLQPFAITRTLRDWRAG